MHAAQRKIGLLQLEEAVDVAKMTVQSAERRGEDATDAAGGLRGGGAGGGRVVEPRSRARMQSP